MVLYCTTQCRILPQPHKGIAAQLASLVPDNEPLIYMNHWLTLLAMRASLKKGVAWSDVSWRASGVTEELWNCMYVYVCRGRRGC